MEEETKAEKQPKKRRTKGDIASLVILIVLAVILIPVFVVNLTLIIKGSTDEDVPPDIFGVAPMAVTTGSMDGEEEGGFAAGALIFVRLLDEEGRQRLQEGDIVTYRTKDIFVTHRIVRVVRADPADGESAIVYVVTKGDASPGDDGAVPIENVIGLCTGSVAGLGGFAMFLHTPVGIVVVVGVPVLLYVAYDVMRIALSNRRSKQQEAAAEAENESEKDAEIRRLRELLAAREGQESGQEGQEGLQAAPQEAAASAAPNNGEEEDGR